MSTVMSMEWTGVTQDQYNQVMRILDLDKNPPAGGIFHVAGFTAGTLRVVDVWESQQAFEKFQKDRLNAAVNAAISEPTVKERLAQLGSEGGGGAPEEYAELIRRDSAKWADVIKRTGARID